MIDISFRSNKALIYGDDIASVPRRFIKINKEEALLKTLNFKGRALNSATLNNVSSGGGIDIYFALIDKYNYIVRSDSASKLFIK